MSPAAPDGREPVQQKSQLAGEDAVGAASFLTVDWAASPGMA